MQGDGKTYANPLSIALLQAQTASGKFRRGRHEGESSHGGPLEPAHAEPSCKIAQAGEPSGGEAKSGPEAGDGFRPCVRIGADPLQHRGETGIDGSAFVRPR